MSSSDAWVHVRTERDVPAGIELLDGRRAVVASGVGAIRQRVPLGLYRLRVTTGAHSHEQLIALEEDGYEDLALHAPVLTAAPVFRTRASHEFHVAAAHRLLSQPQESLGQGARLVVMVRNLAVSEQPDYRAQLEQPIPMEQLRLVRLDAADGSREDSIVAAEAIAIGDPSQGWAGFSVDLDPGPHALRWEQPREHGHGFWRNPTRVIHQAIHVTRDWSTMVFVGHRGDTGLMRVNASIHMARAGEWTGDERTDVAAEVVLSGLRRGMSLVSDESVHALLDAKLKNPMAGLLGAYALLLQPEPSLHLVEIVINNLRELVGEEHPDWQALAVLARERGFDALPLPRVTGIPMFEPGFRALIQRDPLHGGLLEPGSLAERVAPRLRAEMPWTTWVPLGEQRWDPSHHMPELETFRSGGDGLEALAPRPHGPIAQLDSPEVRRVTEWMSQSERYGMSPSTLSMAEIAEHVALPLATTARVLRELGALALGAAKGATTAVTTLAATKKKSVTKRAATQKARSAGTPLFGMKSATKKSATKKSATKKSATKKSATKKSAKKKAARKRAARKKGATKKASKKRGR